MPDCHVKLQESDIFFNVIGSMLHRFGQFIRTITAQAKVENLRKIMSHICLPKKTVKNLVSWQID